MNSGERILKLDEIPKKNEMIYKKCTDLESVEFIYPVEVHDVTPTDMYDTTLEDGALSSDPSEYKSFRKFYSSNHSIMVIISCYYKDKTNGSTPHYYEESAEEVLSILLTKGAGYITPLNDNPYVYSTKAEDDFIAYKLSTDSDENNLKYYSYHYISPGDPEIRIDIQYPRELKEEFDLYVDEFEKTIKRK